MRIIKAIVVGVAIGAVLALFFAGCSDAPSQEPVQATAGWSPPTYGTPVVHYLLQHQEEGGIWQTVSDTPDTFYTLTITYFDAHRVRVCGVDAQGRQGPYSLPSDWHTPADHRPGQPTDVVWEL